MKRRIIVIMTVILALTGLRIQAQDAMFSQYYANPLYLNPAFAGTNVCPRLAFHFRDQWPSMPGTFMTYTASFDEHFDKISGGVGVLLFGDRAGEGGIINTYTASAMYSFKLKVTKNFNMRFALQATYENRGLNWDELTFPDMIDPKYGFIYQTSEQPGKLNIPLLICLPVSSATHHISISVSQPIILSPSTTFRDFFPTVWKAPTTTVLLNGPPTSVDIST